MTTPVSPILLPVVALAAWTMLIWAWMYATRLPAMSRAKMKPDPQMPRGEQMNLLPASVRWKADNYNHLMEQPTVFYAVALVLALVGQGEGTSLMLAWGYVGVRVVHSLLQALINKIEIRFVLFFISSLLLIGLIWQAACAVL